MTQQQQPPPPPDDSYPAAWFPQLQKPSRQELMRQLSELPDDALEWALEEGNRWQEGTV
jgi:hypothetical protein